MFPVLYKLSNDLACPIMYDEIEKFYPIVTLAAIAYQENI